MKSKIKNVPAADLEAIAQVGAQKISELQRKYSPAQLGILEERRRFKKKLDYWEAGYKKSGRALFAFLPLAAGFGWLVGPTFLNFFAALWLSQRGISSMIWLIIGLAIYNIADVGRIWLFYHKYYPPEEKKEAEESSVKDAPEIDDKALVEAVQKEIEKQGGMSTTNIINLLKIDIKPRELGMLLKERGFVQGRGRSGRVWKPPHPIDIICDTPVDASIDRRLTQDDRSPTEELTDDNR